MKTLSKKKLLEQLSAYVDGELSPEELEEVERFLAKDAEAARQVRELRSVKRLLASKEQLPERLGFWTRLSAELDRQSKEEENLFPFPRRVMPYVSIAAVVALASIGFLLFERRGSVMEYVNQQAENVQKAVGENLLTGSLMPLFSNIDKNQVLQFALFGTLPLDAQAETSFRVDDSAEKGYRIDVGKTQDQPAQVVTVRDLYRELKPSAVQAQVIDSLLDIGREKIESSVFIAEETGMAIDANLPKFNRVMLSSIAATLEPLQRVKFEKFLKVRNSPYMVTATNAIPVPPEMIYREIHRSPGSERFIVVTPDTFAFAVAPPQHEQIERTRRQVDVHRQEMHAKVDVLIRKFAEREGDTRMRVDVRNEPVRVFGDPGVITIEIDRNSEDLPSSHRITMVRPRIPSPGVFVQAPKGRSYGFRFYNTDSMFTFDMQIDSTIVRMLQKPGGSGRVEEFEQLWQEQRIRSGMPPDSAQMNRIMESFHKGTMSFDSLMNIINREELREMVGDRKKRVRVREQ
ncbi:MAG: zf-HC2 domain-containing protein [Bacteroidota bacterium]